MCSVRRLDQSTLPGVVSTMFQTAPTPEMWCRWMSKVCLLSPKSPDETPRDPVRGPFYTPVPKSGAFWSAQRTRLWIEFLVQT